jgi:hypothetical protein
MEPFKSRLEAEISISGDFQAAANCAESLDRFILQRATTPKTKLSVIFTVISASAGNNTS